MTGPSWKTFVLERHPRAAVHSKTQPTKRFVCLDMVDDRELGVSTLSTGDAWRVAWINIRDGVAADQAPGQSLLL